MELKASAILRYLGDLKSILLSVAIFNFVVTLKLVAEMGFSCFPPPRGVVWASLLPPTVLLISCLFLSLNRWWTNAVALLGSGYLLGYFVYSLLLNDSIANLEYVWTRTSVLGLTGHFFFSLIVFGYSAVSLKRHVLSRKLKAFD